MLLYPLGLTDTDFSDGTTEASWSPESFIYGAHIVISEAGTVTQMGVKARTSGGTVALKFGLYDSGGSLVVQSTGSLTLGGAVAWVDSGTFSASVSAGTYHVMVSAASNSANYGYDTSGNGSYATEAYATAMASSETITGPTGGDANSIYGVRLDFTAGTLSPIAAAISS